MTCKYLDKPTKENKGKNTTTKPSFRTWLLAFIDEDNPFGDLARDGRDDRGWKGTSALSLKKRLEAHWIFEGDDAHNTFIRARRVYRQCFKLVD